MTSKEALEKLSYIPIYKEDEHNVITDIDSCCIYKGDLCEVYGSEVDTIEKDLEVLDIIKRSITHKEKHKYVLNEKLKGQKFMTISVCVSGDTDFNKVKERLENERISKN